eukprot:6429928-Pyramimonas_sp.AAC.1
MDFSSGGGLDGRLSTFSASFFGLRKYSGGESNSPVVEWHNKGVTSANSRQLNNTLHLRLTERGCVGRYRRDERHVLIPRGARTTCGVRTSSCAPKVMVPSMA